MSGETGAPVLPTCPRGWAPERERDEHLHQPASGRSRQIIFYVPFISLKHCNNPRENQASLGDR